MLQLHLSWGKPIQTRKKDGPTQQQKQWTRQNLQLQSLTGNLYRTSHLPEFLPRSLLNIHSHKSRASEVDVQTPFPVHYRDRNVHIKMTRIPAAKKTQTTRCYYDFCNSHITHHNTFSHLPHQTNYLCCVIHQVIFHIKPIIRCF